MNNDDLRAAVVGTVRMTVCNQALALAIGALWGAVWVGHGLPFEGLLAMAVICAFVHTIVVAFYKA